jgi:transcriptional regulator with XRE-family HTH domain
MSRVPVITPASFADFGSLLHFLRKRARLTQQDLAVATGYSLSQICRLEQNQRLPDPIALATRFLPALDLSDEPEFAARLLALAAGRRAASDILPVATSQSAAVEILSTGDTILLEAIPAAPQPMVGRPAALAQLSFWLTNERAVGLGGLAGAGKTALAAELARNYAPAAPVFWLTFGAGDNTTVAAIVCQLARFVFAHGQLVVEPLLRTSGAELPLESQLKLIGAALMQLVSLRGEPPLLCFDDAHLVRDDPEVIRALGHLRATTPAMLLLVGRESVALPGVAQMRLDGLPRAESLNLIAQADGPRDAALAARLAERTGGNPMLLRLALHQLAESARPKAIVARLEAQPPLASYIAEAILGNLAPPARRLVELLAVLRRPANLIDETLVEAIQTYDGQYDLSAALAILQRRQLIDQSGRAALHPLVHDYLYSALDEPRRRQLHRVAAEWSELAGDIVEAAYHYCRAGLIEHATELLVGQESALIRAGRHLGAIEILDEALARATPLADTSGLVRQLLTTRGDLLIGARRSAEAAANYRDALALATHPAVRAGLVRRMVNLPRPRGLASAPGSRARSNVALAVA